VDDQRCVGRGGCVRSRDVTHHHRRSECAWIGDGTGFARGGNGDADIAFDVRATIDFVERRRPQRRGSLNPCRSQRRRARDRLPRSLTYRGIARRNFSAHTNTNGDPGRNLKSWRLDRSDGQRPRSVENRGVEDRRACSPRGGL
jgi:hypothetical protein